MKCSMVEHVFVLVQEKKIEFRLLKDKNCYLSCSRPKKKLKMHILWNKTNNITFTPPTKAYIITYVTYQIIYVHIFLHNEEKLAPNFLYSMHQCKKIILNTIKFENCFNLWKKTTNQLFACQNVTLVTIFLSR